MFFNRLNWKYQIKRYIIMIFVVLLSFCLSNAQDASKTQFMNQPWKMHHLDRQFWNHNSLSPGDVNGDGFDDYVVIHEPTGNVTILFHPGVNNKQYSLYHA
jgi:hypothetical protein